MAGNNSSAAIIITKSQELVASCSPVAEQMKMLVSKAEQLVSEETALGKAMVQQMRKLIKIGDGASGASNISKAERVEINASPDLEVWLEKVYEAISEADDLLDECEYHRHHHRAIQPLPRNEDDDAKDSKSEVRKYLWSVSSSLARPITSTIVRPVTSYFEWSDTVKKFKSINSKLKRVLGEGIGVISGIKPADQNKDQRSAVLQAMKDVLDIESKVVLEQNDLGEIVDELLYSENDKDLSFISLVGWSETGKRPLARQVYKNEEVKFHYDERMWVQVSSNFDNNRIAKAMLTSLTRTRVEVSPTQTKPNLPVNSHLEVNKHGGEGRVYVDLSSTRRVAVSTEEVIDGRLKERLKGRRYLLVVDGLSEVQAPNLKKFLEGLGGAKGCKVLTTASKDPKAAAVKEPKGIAGKGSPSVVYYHKHMMNLKTDDYCNILFKKICFPVPHVVFDKCPGDAYYLKILGSLMCRVKDEIQGKRIEDASKAWKNPPNHDIVKLCFDYMSSLPLKRCLQCCCLFPKGCLIPREELIQLWMALGYLNPQSENDTEMADLGLKYYDILLKCGFLQVSEEDDFDRKTCKVSDLLWDVIKFPGLRAVEKKQDVVDFKGALHLLITCEVEFTKSMMSCFSNLRSLRLENCGGLEGFLDCAPGLRVLIFVDESVEELPRSIGKLIHLKYLDISKTKIERLPDTFSELYNLQTLRLYGLVNIPRNFKNLLCLQHISIRNDHLSTVNVFASKLHGLVKVCHNKSSLKVFLDKDGYIDSWGWLQVPTTCSSISIHCLENATTDTVREQTAGFVKKHGIEAVKLYWSARRENSYDEDLVLENLVPNGKLKSLAIENFLGTSFPPWMMNISPSFLLHNLVKMEFENCSWCKELPPLGGFHSLMILKILRLDSVRQISREFYGTDDTSFPKLKVFILCQMKNLEVWYESGREDKPFPALSRLEVEECPKLTSIPNMDGMCLRKLRIAHTKMLTTLAGSMESLADLELFGFPALREFPIGTASSLKCLKIGCFKGSLDGLSSQLGHLTSLTNLTIWGYDQLKTLPDWLVDLCSLQVLKLEFCESLKYFPSAEKMQLLTCLTELNISNCPALEERFIRGSRPEWKKVHRISSIIVNDETINPPQIEIGSEKAVIAEHEAGHAILRTASASLLRVEENKNTMIVNIPNRISIYFRKVHVMLSGA